MQRNVVLYPPERAGLTHFSVTEDLHQAIRKFFEHHLHNRLFSLGQSEKYTMNLLCGSQPDQHPPALSDVWKLLIVPVQ